MAADGGLDPAGVIRTDCGLVDFGCKAEQALEDGITDLANKTVEAAGDAIASLATFWVGVDTPNVGSTLNSAGRSTPTQTVVFLQNSLTWFVLAAAVGSVLIGALKMIREQRMQPARELMDALIRLALITAGGVTFITLGITGGDEFSEWLLGNATDDFGADLTRSLALDSDSSGLAVIATILVGAIALFAVALQLVLLIVRGGLLIVLAATWPLSASFTNTEPGKQWFGKSTGWLIAFLLYKPAAAIMYAAAFQTLGNGPQGTDDKLVVALTGLTMIVLALIALPALLKFVVPMTASVAGGGGGGGLAVVAGSVATGAVAARGARTGAAMTGGGSPGPSGARPGGAPSGAGGSRGPSGGSGPGGGAGAAGATGAAAQAAGAVATAVRSAATDQTGSDDQGGPRGSN